MNQTCRVSSVPPSQRFGAAGEWQERTCAGHFALRLQVGHVSRVTFSSMNIVVIGLSHHSSPVELREQFAFAEAKIPEALKSLRESGIAGEAVILSTCNRVEIYAATALEPARRLPN